MVNAQELLQVAEIERDRLEKELSEERRTNDGAKSERADLIRRLETLALKVDPDC